MLYRTHDSKSSLSSINTIYDCEVTKETASTYANRTYNEIRWQLMKFLIIAPEYYPIPPVKGTSVETCIYHIAKRLAKQHYVTIISRQTSGYPNRSNFGKLTIIRVQGGERTHYLNCVINEIKGKKFDYIQIDNRPSFLKSIRELFPKTSISLFLHSLTFVTPPKATHRAIRSQLKKANVIVANSASLKKD